ncbi:hypothetical protein AM571_PA00169 (plasmid) [Rhizobium etli 8C-3]|uniref:Uncharacterized protein n=1 Tax=Rhizobium etli 8C-3 TaxID=538025 RepID=A0A1L5PA54_RHIET|nr:hypothetical protein AM571_PA00169 [Rhizobium etli 8C-3]
MPVLDLRKSVGEPGAGGVWTLRSPIRFGDRLHSSIFKQKNLRQRFLRFPILTYS